jgi:hypothetical protein
LYANTPSRTVAVVFAPWEVENNEPAHEKSAKPGKHSQKSMACIVRASIWGGAACAIDSVAWI